MQLLLSTVFAMAALLGGWLLTRTGNDTAGPTLTALWSSLFFWQLQEYLRRMLYTRGRVRSALFNSALANAARLAVLIWWASQGRLTGIAGLHAIAMGSAVALLPGLWQTRRYWTWRISGFRETWQRNWRFGRWIIGGLIANWTSVEFYPILTAGMISFAAAGAYRALQNLVAPIHLLLRAIDTFLTPRAARHYETNGRPALARMLRRVYLTSGIPILALLGLAMAFPTPILRALYGETYLAYSESMVLMAAFYALLYVYWPVQSILKAARRSRPIFGANLLAILAMLSAGVWMIQRWGVNGTIAGQILNALIVAIILWLSWEKLGRVKLAAPQD